MCVSLCPLGAQNGKTEYRSVTYCPDATAEEFMDMYFDDDNRPNWVRAAWGRWARSAPGVQARRILTTD